MSFVFFESALVFFEGASSNYFWSTSHFTKTWPIGGNF